MSETGPGVIAGGMTTIGSFFIISLAPNPNALHLGLSGFIGLLLCLIMMLTAMPALWVIFNRRKTDRSLKAIEDVMGSVVCNWAVSKPKEHFL